MSDGRLPELFCEFPPIAFWPTGALSRPRAHRRHGPGAAPLLLVRSFLGLTHHVPQRTLTVIPHLPQRWGKLALIDLRLGPATVQIEAEGETVSAHGLRQEWRLVTS